jgi:hypothetical protein
MSEQFEYPESPDQSTADPIDFEDFDGQCFENEERQKALDPQVSEAEVEDMIEEAFDDINFSGFDSQGRRAIKNNIMLQVRNNTLSRTETFDLIEGVRHVTKETKKRAYVNPNPNLGDLKYPVGAIAHGDAHHYDTYVDMDAVREAIPKLAQEIVDKRS